MVENPTNWELLSAAVQALSFREWVTNWLAYQFNVQLFFEYYIEAYVRCTRCFFLLPRTGVLKRSSVVQICAVMAVNRRWNQKHSPDLGLTRSLVLLFMRRGPVPPEPIGPECGPEPGVPQPLTPPGAPKKQKRIILKLILKREHHRTARKL